MSKTMTLDAIVHDGNRGNMAASIDIRFMGRRHLRHAPPVVVLLHDHELDAPVPIEVGANLLAATPGSLL